MLARVATLIDSHQLSSSFDRAFILPSKFTTPCPFQSHSFSSINNGYHSFANNVNVSCTLYLRTSNIALMF